MTDNPANTDQHNRLRKIGGRVRRLTGARQKFPMPNPQSGLKIVIVTDAWKPQINGVVTTLDTLGRILERFGNEVLYITPQDFRSVPMPGYSEIRLSLFPNRRVAAKLNAFKPDAVHIATEGPLGRAARRFCRRRNYPYTTSFHTRFPEYTYERIRFPIEWGYALLRDFHKHGEAMMVSTPALMAELDQKGFKNMRLWERGVDTEAFRPMPSDVYDHLPRPIFTYVGRLAVEKTIEDFLDLDLPGTKVLVGSGPQQEELRDRYEKKGVVFDGPQFGDDLARRYTASDVFVFPSRTDTFGLVNVEALACGTPVAAFPVRGPLEIMEHAPPGAGCLDEDLRKACLTALERRDAEACRAHSLEFSWDKSVRQFIGNLEIPGFDEAFWLRSARMVEDPFLP
ncbi:glycosyltransferase family 4 protein [Parvularcula oceani]|uniref:glycosyltransferase family 4 protein n=1 Tax=Parvularcula oceani TaxID=1247963 RepID=UPI0009E07C92|nr:glycosyltransferase family 1 protein [Parvularcula oceani]